MSINSSSYIHRDKLLNLTIGKYNGYKELLIEPIGKMPVIYDINNILTKSNIPDGLLSYTNESTKNNNYGLYRDVNNSNIEISNKVNKYFYNDTYLEQISRKGWVDESLNFIDLFASGGVGVNFNNNSIVLSNYSIGDSLPQKIINVVGNNETKLGEMSLKSLGVSLSNSVLLKLRRDSGFADWLKKPLEIYDSIDKLDTDLLNMSTGLSNIIGSVFPIYLYSEVRNSKIEGFSWFNNADGVYDINNSEFPTDITNTNDLNFVKSSLLYKTKELFKNGKIKTLITTDEGIDVDGKKITRGNPIKYKTGEYSRIWKVNKQYSKIKDLIRPFDNDKVDGLKDILDTNLKRIRPNQNSLNTFGILGNNGFTKITPYSSNELDKTKIKKYMFSIENLAWKGSLDDIMENSSEYGNNNGRIMWFPPYDINFSDNTSVNLNSDSFIGRGEPVYTYVNTERSGTLSFQLVVDHPSMINYYSSVNAEDDDYHRFFAGSDVLRLKEQKKKTPIQKPLTTKQVNIKKVKFKIYFPNNYSGVNESNSDDAINYLRYGKACSLSGGTGYETTSGDNNSLSYELNTPCFKNKFYYRVDDAAMSQILTDNNLKDTKSYGLNGIKGEGLDYSFIEIYDDLIKDSPNIKNYLAKASKITLNGSSSNQGTSSYNKKITKNRINTVSDWLNKRFKGINIEKGEYIKPTIENNNTDISLEKNKKERYVLVTFDITSEEENTFTKYIMDVYNNLDLGNNKSTGETTTRSLRDANNTYGAGENDESKFFKELGINDSFIFEKYSEKIKYFHPAFHSTTPEGFNSRLTFLHQCTRQGPTNKGDKLATNLSFGRPPICILRIGDFYNTKVIFTDLNISFEPLVWDLNTEGIGVQPMVAKVSMNFKFIGGSDLTGPIARLQNAVSFNFFANSSVYDTRSDLWKTNEKGEKNGYEELYNPKYNKNNGDR